MRFHCCMYEECVTVMALSHCGVYASENTPMFENTETTKVFMYHTLWQYEQTDDIIDCP